MAVKIKPTVQQKVERRKAKIPSRFCFRIYAMLSYMPFFGGKYHAKIDVIDSPKDCKGPCFVIWNHQSRRDYLFIKMATAPRRFNMVAGYAEFFRSHLALLFKLVNVIPKKPFYNNDLVAVAGMHRVLKAGGCLALSPEGTSSLFGDNQPITPGTARFIKHYKIPVYCMDLKGSYLTSHKCDIQDRPGKIFGKLYLLFTPEQLASMTPEEIEAKINETFRHDDYEWNKTARIRFKTKGKAASHLEDFCYQCPKCGCEFEMAGEGDKLYCKHCGNGVSIDDYYDFHPLQEDAVYPDSPSKWSQWERAQIIRAIREDPNYSFSAPAKLGFLPTDHILHHHKLSEIVGEGVCTVDHAGLHYEGTAEGKEYSFSLDWNELYCPCVEDDFQTLTFYPNGKTHDLYLGNKGGKVLLLIEEMHRLHVNYWKNFPWFDYMYPEKNVLPPEHPYGPHMGD